MSEIPNIKIGGVNMPVYSLDFSGGGQEKSEITVQFVNRNGEYQIPERNGANVTSIKIGSFFDFNGFCVTATVESQPQGGNILSVKYVDTSGILDQYWVGLKGVHGPGFTTTASGTFNGIILVGTQVDPCQGLSTNPPDPCAPACSDDAGNESTPVFDCLKERDLKILEVSYTFNDLRNAAQSVGIRFGNFPNTAVDYRAKYTGTLREVIRSWCEDYGLTFYWSDSTVNFVDLKVGIAINDSGLDTGRNVTKYSVSYSIENNSTIGNIAYFGAEGENRTYSCSANTSKRFVMTPITLYDLFYDSATNNGGASGKFLRSVYGTVQPMNYLQAACAMSHYSVEFRDLFFFYNVFNLTGPDAVQAYIDDPSSKPMTALGNMKPAKVLREPLPTEPSTDLTLAYQSLVSRMSASEALDFKQKGGYFIIADYNEVLYENLVTMEKELSENFIGKYWIRKTSSGELYSYDAPDATVNYYSYGSEILFPFLQYLPDAVQNASDFIESLIEFDDEGNSTTHGKFLLADRSPMWAPSGNSREIELLLADVANFQMEDIGTEDINEKDLIKPGQVIFKVYPKPDTFVFQTITTDGVNPFEAKNVNLPGVVNGISTSYGLYSAKCTIYQIRTPAAQVRIFTPVQSQDNFGTQYPGYGIFANGLNIEMNNSVILPKAEYVLGNVPKLDSKSMSLQINFRDATQNLVNFVSSGCGYDRSKIQASLTNFNARTFTTAALEQETRTYEVSGIPEKKFNMTDGLQSFQIRYNNGVITTLTFSNIPKVPKSEVMIGRDFEIQQTQLNRARDYYRQ